jgi:hypothetical protein
MKLATQDYCLYAGLTQGFDYQPGAVAEPFGRE